MSLNHATYRDAKTSKKVTMKAKEENVFIKFSHIGNLEDLSVEVFADASLGNVEKYHETKSVMGMFIALRGKENIINPLHWKAKVIDKVAQDIKTAGTLTLKNAIDDSIHLADMLSEVYFGDSEKFKIPLVVNEDSKSLVESLYSTKKVKRKTMRVVLSSIQQKMKTQRIMKVNHVKSSDQLADILTKKGVSADFILNTVSNGTLKFDKVS